MTRFPVKAVRGMILDSSGYSVNGIPELKVSQAKGVADALNAAYSRGRLDLQEQFKAMMGIPME